MGYRIALWRNGPHWNQPFESYCDFPGYSLKYAGWGASINELIRIVMNIDPQADWFVGGGDDTDPDPTKPAEAIALECSTYFGEKQLRIVQAVRFLEDGVNEMAREPHFRSTFGVMQPTGDRWGEGEVWAQQRFPNAPAYIDRICGSPWIGREFARRMNGGKGPFWPEYLHMFGDEELQVVAQKLGVLWQRRDLTHFHDHPRRDGVAHTPDFAQEIYSNEHWVKSRTLFESRRRDGFPGSEPIA